MKTTCFTWHLPPQNVTLTAYQDQRLGPFSIFIFILILFISFNLILIWKLFTQTYFICFYNFLECTLNLSASQPCGVSISWANNFGKFTFLHSTTFPEGKKYIQKFLTGHNTHERVKGKNYRTKSLKSMAARTSKVALWIEVLYKKATMHRTEKISPLYWSDFSERKKLF
jgi:hypothetical protein